MHLLYAERGGGRRHITSVGENKPGKLRALSPTLQAVAAVRVAPTRCVASTAHPNSTALLHNCRLLSTVDHMSRLCGRHVPQSCVECGAGDVAAAVP